jgi:hypothetical protein
LNDKIELQEHAREFARWMILRMLYAGRPGGVSETILLCVLQSLDFNCELDDVRRGMDYLHSVGLAEAGEDGLKGRWARLTELGVAVVEYSAHAPSGIDSPRRWRNSKRRLPCRL